MSYFAATAIRMAQGQITHVLLRPLGAQKPSKENTCIKISEGTLLSVTEVAEWIRQGDTVYIGQAEFPHNQIGLGAELRADVGQGAPLVSDPPEALGQLPRA